MLSVEVENRLLVLVQNVLRDEAVQGDSLNKYSNPGPLPLLLERLFDGFLDVLMSRSVKGPHRNLAFCIHGETVIESGPVSEHNQVS